MEGMSLIMKKRKINIAELGKVNFDEYGFDIPHFENKPDGTPFDDLSYTGNLEKDTKMELNEYQKALKESKRKYEKTMEGVFDSEFWFAVAFKDRESKESFLKEFGIDKLGDKYIDGGKLAKILRKK